MTHRPEGADEIDTRLTRGDWPVLITMGAACGGFIAFVLIAALVTP